MKLKKAFGIVLIGLILAMIVTGCGDTAVDEDIKENIEDGEEIVEEIEDDQKIVIEHELGVAEFEKIPEKILVFDYGLLDIVDNLDGNIQGLPKSNIPPHLKEFDTDEYEDIGTLFEPNFEKIFELEPDVIFISGRQAEVYDDLNDIAPTVYLPIYGEEYMDSFENNVKQIAKILDKEDEAEERLEDIRISIEELHKKSVDSGKKALFLMANDNELSVYGKDSRFGMLHEEFGVAAADENIEASNHGQKVSYEYLAEIDPDLIFVMDRGAVVGGDAKEASQVMDNDLVNSTKAAKNDDIHYLDAYVWYVSSGGLTGTEKMIEEVDSAIK